MKKILIFLFVMVCAGIASAQPHWNKVYSYNEYLGLQADSVLTPPQDTLRSATNGSLGIKNNHVYQKNSSGVWTQVDGGGNAVQSLTGSQSIQYGPFNSMPSPGTTGRFYAATDSSRWYFDNGVAWLNLSGSGGGTSGAILTFGTGLMAGTYNGSTPVSIIVDTNFMSTRAWRQKGLDSLGALYKLKADSAATNPAAFTTQASRQKLADSLLAVLMHNFGGAPGQLQGTYAGIPAATSYATGTTYIAQDSGFQYVDTGSGSMRGWKRLIGGAGGGGLSAPVANSSLATMPIATIKANLTGSVTTPQDVTASALATALSAIIDPSGSVQFVKYGAYASRPITGFGIYVASDSIQTGGIFYINNSSTPINLTPQITLSVLGNTQSGGDTTMITLSGNLVSGFHLNVAGIRDSSNSCTKHIVNADHSWTFYSTCIVWNGSRGVFPASPIVTPLTAGQRVMTDPATDTLTVQPEIMHQPVHYIANAALAPNTYSNGTAGVGATLTGSSNGYLLVDGDTTVLNDRVLVDQEADSTHNGIYSVTTKGDASHAYVLTRTPFASVPSNMRAGSMVIADSGLTNQGAVFYQTTTGAITFGTTKLAYKALSLRPAANLADVPNKSLAASNLGIIPYQSVNVGFAAAGANPDYTVLASAILQPTNAFTLNGPITWGLITFGGHGASFFDSLYPDPVLTQRLDLVFPQVKSVLTVVIGNDESTQAQGVVIGPTVSFTSAQFAASMPTLGEAILTGNGTSTWSTAVSAGSLSISTFSTTNGQTSIGWTTPNNLTQFAITANTPIVYQGPNQYTIDRTYSGLGAYTAAFNIVEPNGGYLDTYPTANDKVIIGPMSTGMQALHLGIWTSTNSWLAAGANANFWVIGMFEAWMIASPVTSTTNQIKWQLLWPGATQYKIYRDVSMAFSSPTLVYTGNAGVFTDTGLTPGAVYYYKEMATVSGVDQFVTTFPCPTKPY